MRAVHSLQQRYKAVLHHTGSILLLGAVLMLTPLTALTVWPGERGVPVGFLIPAGSLLLLGALLWFLFRREAGEMLTVQDGGVIVLLSWTTVCLFCAWPFVAVQKLTFTQALFESVSGWTTTGLSVIDVTEADHVILLWRSIMQLAGGAGLAIIMLAAIVGPSGPAVSIAEGRSEQLVPNVRGSAKLVLLLYSGYAVFGTVAYFLAGMSWFDAVNQVFAAISTGGFSTRPTSIGYWNSPAIEAVSIVLMGLGNLNFFTAYLLVHGRLRAVGRNGEIRLMAVLIPLGVLVLFFFVCRGLYPTLGKSVRVSIFETVSALTTTGFSTVSYTGWNALGRQVLIVLMLIGGGTGSTAGGLKQYRVYVLFQSVVWEVRRSLLPRSAVVQNYIWQGERKDFITESRIQRIGTFAFLYLATFLMGTGVIAASGYGLANSLFEFASALGTVGLSIGITGGHTPAAVLWVEIVGMFLGRLEFFVIIVSLLRIFRDLPSLVGRARP